MVKNLYAARADKRDRRDDSTKNKQNNLAQRREGRDLEDGRALVKALQRKLEEAKAGGAAEKQDRYAKAANELVLEEQQLKDEQRKVSRLEAELVEQKRATAAVEASSTVIPSLDDLQATTERLEQDASQARAAVKQKEEALRQPRYKLKITELAVELLVNPSAFDEKPIELYNRTIINIRGPGDEIASPFHAPDPSSASLTAEHPHPVAFLRELMGVNGKSLSRKLTPEMELLHHTLLLSAGLLDSNRTAGERWATPFLKGGHSPEAGVSIYYLDSNDEHRNFVYALDISFTVNALSASLIRARQLELPLQATRQAAHQKAVSSSNKMYKELSKARATLEHVESRRSELEAELASAKAKLVAHDVSGSSPSSKPSPKSTAAASFAIQRMATLTKQLNETILALRKSNLELCMRISGDGSK